MAPPDPSLLLSLSRSVTYGRDRWRDRCHMLDEHGQEEKLCFFFLHCGLVVGFPHKKKQGGVKSMHSPKQQPQMQWKAQLQLFLTTHPITALTDWTLQSINESSKCWERKRDIGIHIYGKRERERAFSCLLVTWKETLTNEQQGRAFNDG